MISVAKIKYNEPIYYAPSYGNSMKVSIIKLIADDVALVQPSLRKKKDFKPFPIPITHIYNKPEDANRGRREWENYMRKRKRGQKNDKQKKYN